jgi:4-hydroxybutyrate CoA-transferase
MLENFTTIEKALELIEPGSSVVLHSACAEPQTLLSALIEGIKTGQPHLQGLTVCALTYRDGKSPLPLYAEPELLQSGLLKHQSFFPHAVLRPATRAGLVDYIPSSFSNVPYLIRNGFVRADVAMLTVSPPDADGFCTLSIGYDYAEALVDTARVRIAEVNRFAPVTNGVRVPISKFHAVIETATPLLEVPPARIETIDRQVAANVMEFVRDGATVQLGVGTIPEAVIEYLKERRNLNFHSGAISDGVVDLIESGALTNAGKPIDTGLTVTSLLIGTKKLFDYAHNNPNFGFRPIDYTNSPLIMVQLPDFVSINSAIEVDYWGQVNAEQVGDWQLSGIGGQLDFVTGAWVNGGVSIIALPSTTANGKPRIVPRLSEAVPVSTPRHLAQIVITEKGIADLRGKSLSERERLLKAIATT